VSEPSSLSASVVHRAREHLAAPTGWELAEALQRLHEHLATVQSLARECDRTSDPDAPVHSELRLAESNARRELRFIFGEQRAEVDTAESLLQRLAQVMPEGTQITIKPPTGASNAAQT